jgi:hypothetical protein
MAKLPTLGVAAIAAISLPQGTHADVSVHGPDEVHRRWISPAGDTLILSVGTRSWSLVTDPAAPELSKLGDGAFHPMDPAQVREAVSSLAWPNDMLPAGRILVLPFPRAAELKSSCEKGTIFLSPGIREVHPEHVHATVAHEIGHLVQQRLAPDGSVEWERYLQLRGLDPARHHASAAHRDRPHEIFAEDFRVLYGGTLATASGTQENPDLELASENAGLVAWFEELRRRPGPEARATPDPQGFPNPFSTAGDAAELEVRFHAVGSTPGPHLAEVFDVTGRSIARLHGATGGSDTMVFRWNGRDASGRRAASGVYLVRWLDNPAAGTARVHVLR